MGQCCGKTQTEKPVKRAYSPPRVKQNKDVGDKRMFKIGVEVLRKDFCVQIGYNRRAVKNYSTAVGDSVEVVPIQKCEEIVDIEDEQNDIQEIH